MDFISHDSTCDLSDRLWKNYQTNIGSNITHCGNIIIHIVVVLSAIVRYYNPTKCDRIIRHIVVVLKDIVR